MFSGNDFSYTQEVTINIPHYKDSIQTGVKLVINTLAWASWVLKLWMYCHACLWRRCFLKIDLLYMYICVWVTVYARGWWGCRCVDYRAVVSACYVGPGVQAVFLMIWVGTLNHRAISLHLWKVYFVLDLFLIYVSKWFACVYESALHACLVPAVARTGSNPLEWNWGRLCIAFWVLGTEPQVLC